MECDISTREYSLYSRHHIRLLLATERTRSTL